MMCIVLSEYGLNFSLDTTQILLGKAKNNDSFLLCKQSHKLFKM